MNFIKLLFKLKLENKDFSTYSDTDFIKLEKLIKSERQINIDISSDTGNKLLQIVKTNPEELKYFLKEKNLALLLIETRKYYRKTKPFSNPDFNIFFNDFIENDLRLIFKKNTYKKDYVALNRIMTYKKYFSFDFENEIRETFQNKLKNAYDHYLNKPFIKHKEYDFLEKPSFFKLINHFDYLTINLYILNIYNIITVQTNKTNYSKYPLKCLIAFGNYKTKNIDFQNTLVKNKKFAENRLNYLTDKYYSFKIFLSLLGVILWFLLIYLILKLQY